MEDFLKGRDLVWEVTQLIDDLVNANKLEMPLYQQMQSPSFSSLSTAPTFKQDPSWGPGHGTFPGKRYKII